MGELHSIAYSNSSSLGWDLQNLGILNADMSLGGVMDGSSNSQFFSSLVSDFSTGYLEDALVEFGERFPRRRLLLYSTDDQIRGPSDPAEVHNYYNSNCKWDISENFSCMSQITDLLGVSDEHISTSMSNTSTEEEANIFSDTKTAEDAISAPETFESPSSSYKPKTHYGSTTSTDDDKRKKRKILRVVYPFAMVKPGGIEGDMTLNDINERILMPPTRPVRHPVGDFACRPCVSADGPGLSGKAVVALTRIHTQGRRGTITIIRTKD
ncbi:hypothetical protein HS088_TW13G00676 [Tripterygium wilfordii]|uniref:Protein XRI1 n=1 Tax=Tripterygium wilfordii TaxID=458696 RepID=A0A7J7CV66_TRIWF|nr:uncharacterized protein LOC120013499 [Tripterygium wilfordii]KAF5737786.1 hypothetical protein HS088_TW13G00676 [Tripterygium wilfordii]